MDRTSSEKTRKILGYGKEKTLCAEDENPKLSKKDLGEDIKENNFQSRKDQWAKIGAKGRGHGKGNVETNVERSQTRGIEFSEGERLGKIIGEVGLEGYNQDSEKIRNWVGGGGTNWNPQGVAWSIKVFY